MMRSGRAWVKICAAWSYIHHERDAAFYSPEDVVCVMDLVGLGDGT